MTVVEIGENNTITVGDYWSATYSKPSRDNINNVVLLGWDSDFSTYLKVKFARPLITGDPQDNPLENGKKYVFALAWSDSKSLSFHQNTLNSFGVAIGQDLFLLQQP
jgi:hypothetical protein